VSTESHDRAARHDPIYDRLAESSEFQELRRRYRSFAFPATIAFLTWYLLYVVMSMFAPGIMDARIVGKINVALAFGVLQFVTTFLIAYLYSRYSSARLDPIAQELEREFLGGREEGGRA